MNGASSTAVKRIAKKSGSTAKRIPVISLFSGAMGLDLGLEQSGLEVVLAVECDSQAVATIKQNRPDLPVINRKIEDVTTKEILEAAGLRPGGAFVVSGGPSCQSFSTAGQRRSLADPRGGLFHHFVRIVRESQPKFFIMENVKGMLSAAIKHRPLNERGPGFPPLSSDEELGSAFRVIIKELRRLNYYTVFDVLNAADYGSPQSRERILFIGSREGKAVSMPLRTHNPTGSNGLKQWTNLKNAIGDLDDQEPVGVRFSPKVVAFLKKIPAGGNWRNLAPNEQKEALGGAFISWGGRSGFYRRLAWDKPSPALTTQPDSKATMLCHPSEPRPLSLQEYARIQQFPENWTFSGPVASQYRQIGNAVPVGLGAALGRAILLSWNKWNNTSRVGTVETHNEELLRKMAERPVTILNPPRMRKKAYTGADEAWASIKRKKRDVKQYAVRKSTVKKTA
ncbi:MAG: DNA cytosine methyltransferase [Candidatus Melainabacteria bacterium]|nr:DNA cytosine methyltransferase [Candidatus Melainabacteria bacterium]